MKCRYISLNVGSKRYLSGRTRNNFLTSMIDHGIFPCELRKDTARKIMVYGEYMKL